ncbi:MAG TPA: hypothetical protein VGM82_10495 [Gemmatimonadaceae bacterium]
MDNTGRINQSEDIPSLEPWVVTLLSTFVPVALAFVFPSAMWVFFALTAIIFVAAMVMLRNQERARRDAVKQSSRG